MGGVAICAPRSDRFLHTAAGDADAAQRPFARHFIQTVEGGRKVGPKCAVDMYMEVFFSISRTRSRKRVLLYGFYIFSSTILFPLSIGKDIGKVRHFFSVLALAAQPNGYDRFFRSFGRSFVRRRMHECIVCNPVRPTLSFYYFYYFIVALGENG